MAVDMETATLFSCGFANHIPTGALLLVSDQPMIPEGVKTDKSDNMVTQNYVNEHVEIGIASLRMIIDEKKTVKTLEVRLVILFTGHTLVTLTLYGKTRNDL